MEPSTCWCSSTLGMARMRSTSWGMERMVACRAMALAVRRRLSARRRRRRAPVVEPDAPPLPALDEEGMRRAASHLAAADPVMAQLIARVGPPRHRHRPAPLFPALTESIVYQQITGKAAETIHGRVLKVLGRRRPRAEDVMAASDEALRGAGLSRMKVTYLRDLARRCQAGLPVRGLARRGD